MLNKQQILEIQDATLETLSVPEWGGSVCVRVMSGFDRDKFESEMIQDKNKSLQNFRAKLAAVCLCDEKGIKLFSDSDIVALGSKSSAALQRVFDASMKLNKMGASDVEELRKN